MSHFLLTAFNSFNLVQKNVPYFGFIGNHLVKVCSKMRTRDMFSGIKTRLCGRLRSLF